MRKPLGGLSSDRNLSYYNSNCEPGTKWLTRSLETMILVVHTAVLNDRKTVRRSCRAKSGCRTGSKSVSQLVVRFLGSKGSRDRNPRESGVLSRFGRRAGRRRPDRRRRPGGTFHPQEARRRLPRPGHRVLPRRRRADARPTRLRRLLRQAAAEVRAAAGNLPGLTPPPASARSCRPCRCGCTRSCTCRGRSAGACKAATASGCVFTEHHESHAASAFFPSPFDEAAILTLDGVGEWATASFGYGRGNRITLTHELRFPHSLGLLYSAFTYFCGFQVNSGEYKLMGLAPYGEPSYADVIRREAARPEGRRLVPPGHVVLQLLPGADHDLAEVRAAVRRPAAAARGRR